MLLTQERDDIAKYWEEIINVIDDGLGLKPMQHRCLKMAVALQDATFFEKSEEKPAICFAPIENNVIYAANLFTQNNATKGENA